MWTPIPYSVLVDDEWTSTVGPMRPGTTSLPAKTAGYTTSRGKLSQAECNAQAAAFRPSGWDTRHYDDDNWVKFNLDDRRADASYKSAQSRSRTLHDRGAGLTGEDLVESPGAVVG
jgi:hypothetical protein